MSKTPPNPENNIEQIRALIFGPQMQAYQDQFDNFNGELKQLRKDLNASVARIENMIENMQQTSTSATADLHTSLGETRSRVEKNILETEKRIENRLSLLDNQSTNRHQLADFLDQLSTQLRGSAEAHAQENGKNE